MDYRKYLLILLFLAAAIGIKAQAQTYQKTDSVSEALFTAGSWKQLVLYGDESIKDNIDFPALRLKLGYAQFMSGNYGAALDEYDAVLRKDAYNQTAKYYEYLCYKYLNNDLLANNSATGLDTASLRLLNVNKAGLVGASLESSYKVAEAANRGNASYTRIGFSNMLFKKVQLDQSVAYYGQYIFSKSTTGNGMVQDIDQQTEYFAKLSYASGNRLTLLGAWHYLYVNYLRNTYNSHLFLAGLNYTGTCFNIQGDINLGHIEDASIKQYDAKLNLYPLGNLNLYFISRGSYLQNSDNHSFVFSQLAGFKAAKNIWLETSGTFGNLDDYIDADGLYIYNAIDDSKLKLGETAYLQLNLHAMIQINYSYEKKLEEQQSVNYNQHSITAGISWKF